jgi:Uma2 family endonuclease
MTALTVNLDRVINLSREQFHALCAANPDVKFERNATGELIIMAPTGGETGRQNIKLATQLENWNDRTGLGVAFDSSTGFSLPNGADRSPDLAWIPLERWQSLSQTERRGFLPLCPDFVLELLSPTDSWLKTQLKMQEYMDNGAQLGWLIDPQAKRVGIYRRGQPVEIVPSPPTLSGEEVLPGFVMHLNFLWE